MAPDSLGPYRLVEKIGAGANGEVYLAEDTRLHRRVAIKTLSVLEGDRLADVRRWVLREARAAARLNHPNIAAVYDVLETEDAGHIVMEYVPGQNLSRRIRDGPIAPPRALEIGVQLAEALAAAHDRGVIHRDLKPSNVMLTPEGTAKILDFGLARTHAVDDASASLRSSQWTGEARKVVGTPAYIPPEHYMGEPADARGDIYSLGVTLFELFTGVRPFEGRSSGDLTAAILSDPTPHARDRNPAVPEALDAIVYRAMARVPDQRFHSARDLADELKRAATRLYEAPTRSGVAAVSVPIAVAPARGALRAMRTATGRRPLLSAAAAIAVAAALYAALASPRSRSFEVSAAPPESPVVAVLPLANTTGHAEDEALATGIADTLVSTLSQVPGVTVVARSATLPYRDRKKSTDDIARALGATLLVDGALQRSGDRVRVNLSLLRPRSNVLSWARSYDGSFSNVFALQHEVATAVANTLRLAIPSDARRRVDRPSTDSVQAFAEYSQARAFLDRPDVKGNLDRAMGLFKSAIAKDPHFARAHAGLGQAYWRRYTESRELDWAMQARDETSEALRLDPADGRVRYTLALIDYSKGRLAEAEEELRRAAESNPTLDDAHNLLGRILNETGRPEEAAAELKLAIELRPAFWGHYQTLGIAYFRRGLWKEASAAFKRVTELQPDSAWGFQMLGTTFQAMGDNAEAVTHYQHAIEIAPDAMAYANLGTIYYSDGRLTEAAHAFEKAMELEPKNAANHRNLGDLYRRVGESTKARAAYGHAIELSMDRLKTNPRDARAMAALAVYEAKIGDNRDSQSHAASALALTRTDPDVLYANAVVYALTGNAAQSMQMLREAIALGYSVAFARTDEDLAVLHGRPEFSPLVEGDGRRQKGG